MPDYKELYLKLFRASENAINILIEAQRACEELHISQPEPKLTLVPLPPENEKRVDQESFQIHASTTGKKRAVLRQLIF